MTTELTTREAPARYVVEAQGIRKGYKQTEVGVIPEDWEVKKLGEVAVIKDGTHQTPKYVESGIPFYSVEHVTSGNFDETKFISEEEHRFLTRSSKIEKGDVLMTRIGSIGDCKLVDWDVNASFYVSLALLKIQGASAAFIAQYSNSSEFKREVELHSLQSAIPKKINLGPISEVKVALPSFSEQEAIAEALSDADALIAALEQLIAKKRHLKQGAMQELLTGKKRLPRFGGEWNTQTIEQLEKSRLLQLSRGNVISKVDIERAPGDFPIYSSSVKNGGVFGTYGEYMFDEELITWSIDGGGHFFHRPKHRFSVTNVCGYMRADTSKFSFQFLAAQLQLLHSKLKFDYQDKAHPSVIRKAYLISIPSLEEQTAIATTLSDMDTEIAALETQLAKARGIKQGMMQELLTGRIRLV